MKKLKLNLADMPDIQVLTREQLKKITGCGVPGSGTPGVDNGNPCPDNCTRYCSKTDGYMPVYGTCPPETGGTTCHNYCCDSSNTFWC